MTKVLYNKLILISPAFIGAIIALCMCTTVGAAAIDWAPASDTTITISETSNTPPVSEIVGQRPCVMRRTVVQGQIDLQDVCFTHGTNLSYGFYRTIYGVTVGVVKYKYDTKAYPLSGIGYAERTAILPGTDTLVSVHHRSDNNSNFTLSIQRNASRSLVKVKSGAGVLDGYGLGNSNYVFKSDEQGYVWPVTALGYSNNNKWLVADVTNTGMVRFNLETGEIRRFSLLQLGNRAPYSALELSLAVSNDGRYAALGGKGFEVPFKVYTITDECAEVFGTAYSSSTEQLTNHPCSEIELRHEATHAMPGSYNYEKSISFSDDGRMLSFYAYQAEPPSGKWVKISSASYAQASIEYLAMGDSYSSGEGDTSVAAGKKFYLPGTDEDGNDTVPREKCHVSSRSYPFLLKSMMSISEVNMKSVACSGAEAERDYLQTNNYRGQNYNGSPRLSTLSPEYLKLYQDSARSSFIPGRIQQLEFISKYKPQAITLTGGGNDIGFGDIIKTCLLSNYYSCSYNSTQPGRAAIGQGIARQYYELTVLFARIKSISPDTKVYIIGYPKFIDDKSFFCPSNVPISQNERKMINEAVSYLNQTIKAAASNSGVKYIDIEDSLAGHKLCDKGTAYVTGLALARKIGFGSTVIGASEEQESFHPNKNGHALMARAIGAELEGQSLVNYDGYPISSGTSRLTNPVTPPLYFAESMTNATAHYLKGDIIPRKYVQKLSTQNIFNIRFGGFEPLSEVRIENHSDPTVLGTYNTDSDGLLSVDIPVPDNIPAGFHTLHLIGLSYSGESIDIWQGIEVRGVSGDIDEDGISDDVDGCMYVSESKMDDDYDEIDDACDPLIDRDGRTGSSRKIAAFYEGSVTQSDIGEIVDTTSPYRSTADAKEVIEDLFYYQLGRSSNIDSRATIAGNVSGYYLLGGIIVSSLILIWVIKRYSIHNGM